MHFFRTKEDFFCHVIHSRCLFVTNMFLLKKNRHVIAAAKVYSLSEYQGECLSFREMLFVNPSDIKL